MKAMSLCLLLGLFTLVAGCEGGFGRTCLYAGRTYASGASFPSEDGCNTCSCGPQGDVACTLRACASLDGGSDGGDVVMCTGATPSFPSFNRSCALASDCAKAIHQINCCGSQRALGLRVSEKARFDAAEKICRGQYPGCGCAAAPTIAEDGKSSADFDGSDIQVDCRAGACTTFIP